MNVLRHWRCYSVKSVRRRKQLFVAFTGRDFFIERSCYVVKLAILETPVVKQPTGSSEPADPRGHVRRELPDVLVLASECNVPVWAQEIGSVFFAVQAIGGRPGTWKRRFGDAEASGRG